MTTMPPTMTTTWKRWRDRAKKLSTHPRPVRFLVSRALWHGGVSRLFTSTLPGGLQVRFYPSSVSAALWVSPEARNDDAAFLRLVLRPGDTYVDCGANIGQLAIIGRDLVGPDGSVTAIEPNPRVFGYCMGNLKLNGFADVLALNVALGETRGAVRISDRRDDDQNRVGDDGVPVPLRPLDEVAGALPIRLLKIDVEGYELNVLRGGRRTLANTRIVYCELSASNSARFGTEPGQVEDLLLEAGFVLAHRLADRWQTSHRRLYETLASADLPQTGYNLVAIKPDTMAEFEAIVAAHGQSIDT